VSLVATDNGTPALSATNSFTITVEPAPVSVEGLVVASRPYDATTNANITSFGSLNGTLGGDDVVLGTNDVLAYFASPEVGVGKTVSLSGLALSGVDAGNYLLVPPSVSADITAVPLTVTANDTNKVSGQADPLFTASYSGFVAGDTESVLGGTLVITRDPGEAGGTYALTPSGLTSGNYAITFQPGTLTILDIAPVILSLTGAGSTNAVITWSSVSNMTYRVRYRSDLSGGSWVDLVPDVTATNATAAAVDDASGVNRRFYQVIIP
jgi:hypothetical protein